MRRKFTHLFAMLLMCFFSFAFTGCEEEPAEELGESIEEVGEDIEDAVD